MAQHVRGRAIVAVCDVSEYPEMGRRENAASGTMIIYRHGQEVARTMPGVPSPAFAAEMQALGLVFGG